MTDNMMKEKHWLDMGGTSCSKRAKTTADDVIKEICFTSTKNYELITSKRQRWFID
jgi:hypothetical protein